LFGYADVVFVELKFTSRKFEQDDLIFSFSRVGNLRATN